jgi:hypothetical protein
MGLILFVLIDPFFGMSAPFALSQLGKSLSEGITFL